MGIGTNFAESLAGPLCWTGVIRGVRAIGNGPLRHDVGPSHCWGYRCSQLTKLAGDAAGEDIERA